MEKLLLICFPFAGGNASYYNKWKEIYNDKIEIIAIEYPGHGLRINEPLQYSLPQLIDDSYKQIKLEIRDMLFLDTVLVQLWLLKL